MKLTVKTLKGSHFQISVLPNDTVMAVKKNIEDVQGKDNYPCGQQLLIHNGKILKDESTLAENKVSEDGFLVVMLTKNKTLGSSGSMCSQPAPTAAPATNSCPAAEAQPSAMAPLTDDPATDDRFGSAEFLLERNISQLIDMGGGSWNRKMVMRALRAAYNNRERAVDYLYSGIPESNEVAVPLVDPVTVTPASGAPNSSPLNLFPQDSIAVSGAAGLGSLDFLRNNQQFQTLRSMVQANPQILQPMLLELGKQNASLLRLIQENQEDFLQLVNEPFDLSEGDIFNQDEPDMPLAVSVTPAEQEAIERMEAMGFERAVVVEAFLACDRNEELAINYLLEHAGDLED